MGYRGIGKEKRYFDREFKYQLIERHCFEFAVKGMCRVLEDLGAVIINGLNRGVRQSEIECLLVHINRDRGSVTIVKKGG